ncbi:MAG: hypothetical protein IK115_08815 [Lachnospiraceae bacterium]|nr:hypothetical protein [Lachnospiraceae bacterium]
MSKRSNEEWYRRSFDRLHLSDDFGKRLEERLKENGKESKMNTSIHGISRFAAAAIAGVIAFGSFGACYAADLGGIRTRIEIWMNGEKSEVEVEEDGMGYSWTDADGETYGFGGIALDEDGNESPISAEELAAYMNSECTLKAQDGRLMLFYKNLSTDVTDMVSAEGTLNVHISDPKNPYTYFSFSDITSDGTYGCSSSDTPEGGASYIELDASGLTDEAGPAPERSDNEAVGTYTTSD